MHPSAPPGSDGSASAHSTRSAHGGKGSADAAARLPPTRRSLRIVHFTDSLEPSGVGEHICLLACELGALGHQQALVCPDVPAGRSLLERCGALGIPVYGLHVRYAEDRQDYRQLVRLLRERGYDLLHNHAGVTWEGCWGTLAAAEAGVLVVCTEHLPYLITDPGQRALKLRAGRHVTCTIAVSHGIARSLIEAGVAPRDRVRVVWNGIDPPPFTRPRRPEQRRPLLGLDPAHPLVICIGRMAPQKRHDLLLDAAALVGQEVPNLTVALAGDGPLRADLEAQAARLGLAGTVRFLGRYGHVPDLLRCADVLVQPSDFEGLPLAVLEAMAASLPIVVTDTIGNNETVVHEQSGLIVPPDDPASLAAAIVRLLQDRSLAEQFGRKARLRLTAHFTAPIMARRTQAVYEHVLARAAGLLATDQTMPAAAAAVLTPARLARSA